MGSKAVIYQETSLLVSSKQKYSEGLAMYFKWRKQEMYTEFW